MAQAIFNKLSEGMDLSASSCGIYADGISPISDNATKVLKEIGIIFTHISTPITRDLIKEADYIVGMTSYHAENIISLFPDFAEKVYAVPKDISDPYGSNIEMYRACRGEIEVYVKSLIETLTGDNND